MNRLSLPIIALSAVCSSASAGFVVGAEPSRPNIVLIITDDQGYGDLGCHGNPVIKTPHLDALAAESSQLADYHVAPTCSPTRAALLTGHWTDRTGVWHTVNGRSMLRENEVTLARMLQGAGYATGHFGKWHLGDNYPYRPEDRGFTEVYRHGGGGVGQTPDVWDNAYFDGHYFHNGQIVPARGFCTDVFFEQAHRFIREQAANKRPFFAYITTNAPHGPLHAPQKYLDLYTDRPPSIAAFFGMITNIDDNVGATRELLRELEIEQNTLFIFTTDNGTATGASVFNAGMRGAKGSEYDGGHRVPFIAHWPAAGWNRKHLNDTLCHAVDIVPTLLEITGAKKPDAVTFDGISIRRLLEPTADLHDWPHDRMLVTDSQRVRDPIKWKQTSVMSGRWRLVNGKELYDIQADPGQKNNVIGNHPDQAARMRAFYDAWWAELEPTFAQTTEIHLGHPEHPVVSLTGHDWIQEALPPWNQQHIRRAYGYGSAPGGPAKGKKAPPAPRQSSKLRGDLNVAEFARIPKERQHQVSGILANSTTSVQNSQLQEPKSVHRGHWAVKVLTPGDYEISLRRWPLEADHPITAALLPGDDVPGASKAFRTHPGIAIPAIAAVLRIDSRDLETKPVEASEREVTFTATLTAGSHQLAPVFVDAEGNEIGAYYAIVTKHRSGTR